VHRWDNAYVKDLEQFPFDLDRAAALLEEAGWKLNANSVREKVVDGERRELRFKILLPNSRSVYRDFSLLYQKELAKIGVILELQLQEWNQLVKQLDDKDYDAVSLGWGTSWDSDPEQIWHSRQALVAKGSNHCSYMSDTVDGAIEGLQVEFDPERRKELWRVFQETIVHDQPYLFLAIPLRPWVINARMGNIYFSRLRPQIWLVPWYVKEGK
jgi:ABC-type transport system substrate-binding protein